MFSKLQESVDEKEEEKILQEVQAQAEVNAPGSSVEVPSCWLTEKFTISENAEPTRML